MREALLRHIDYRQFGSAAGTPTAQLCHQKHARAFLKFSCRSGGWGRSSLSPQLVESRRLRIAALRTIDGALCHCADQRDTAAIRTIRVYRLIPIARALSQQQ